MPLVISSRMKCPSSQESRTEFLYTGQAQERADKPLRQSTLQPLTGIEWLSRKIVEELTKRAAEVGEWCLEAQAWEDWEPATPGRSRKEEMWLWKQLDELDSRQAKLEKRQNIKKSRKVAKARTKMKVGAEQPSIKAVSYTHLTLPTIYSV